MCAQHMLFLAYVSAYVSDGASYVFPYVFLYAQLLSAVCCCCGFVRCMATGSYWFSIRFSDMLVAAAGSAGYWSHFLLTFALRFAYVFLTLKTAHTKPYENQCSANRTVKHMWKHINCQRHGAWPQSTILPLLYALFGLGHIHQIKNNPKR